MTNAWTKGPWEQDGNYVRHSRGIIANCPVPQQDGVFDCQENARLIAAAPDMAEALESACRDADYGLEHGDPFPPWYEPARAALAKARGETT